MTFRYEEEKSSEKIMASMETANPVVFEKYCDIKRCGSLATHIIEKLGISPEQSEKCWEYNVETGTMFLCLVSPDNDRLINIGIEATQKAADPDFVFVQVVNTRAINGTFGVRYEVRLERNTNRVVEESITVMTGTDMETNDATVRCSVRSEVPVVCTWGQQRTEQPFTGHVDMTSAWKDVWYTPSAIEKTDTLHSGSFTDPTSEESTVIEEKDVFAALIAIAGDISQYQSIPVSELD